MKTQIKRILCDLWNAATLSVNLLRGHHPNGRTRRVASTVNHIEQILASDAFLQSVCDCTPQVYELSKSQTEKAVIVWLHFRETSVTRTNLFNAIQIVMRKSSDASLLTSFEAIEVVPYCGANIAGSGRIVRAIVYATALPQVAALAIADFMPTQDRTHAGWYANSKPVPGVVFSWYRNPSEIPE